MEELAKIEVLMKMMDNFTLKELIKLYNVGMSIRKPEDKVVNNPENKINERLD